jgi:hypothetical protein
MNRESAFAWYNWFVSKSLEYSFIAAVWLTWFTERSVTLSRKTWRGIQDAHTETVWIYTGHNNRPWPCKSEPALTDITMRYYPEKTEFEVTNTPSHERHRIDDLVEAILVSKDGLIRQDMTSFFMDVKWRGTGPSLYEMVYAFFLQQGWPISPRMLRSCKLHVETLEYPNLRISLHRGRNAKILEPFQGWQVFGLASAPALQDQTTTTTTPPLPQTQTQTVTTTSWVELQRDVAEGANATT